LPSIIAKELPSWLIVVPAIAKLAIPMGRQCKARNETNQTYQDSIQIWRHVNPMIYGYVKCAKRADQKHKLQRTRNRAHAGTVE